MSEEVRRAKNAVPRSMVLTIITNGALAYAMGLVLAFTESPEGISNQDYPIISTLYLATGSKAAVNALVSMLLILTFAVVTASLASTSRITWAWARDGALPKWFAHVRLPSSTHTSLTSPTGVISRSMLADQSNTESPNQSDLASRLDCGTSIAVEHWLDDHHRL